MTQKVYIVRANDGSWAALAANEDQARQLIAEHEPDAARRDNDYSVIVDTMDRLMADQVPGIRRGLQQRLVKWDGDGPIPDDASTHPEKYPQVIEVIEGGDGIPTKTIYRRDQSCL